MVAAGKPANGTELVLEAPRPRRSKGLAGFEACSLPPGRCGAGCGERQRKTKLAAGSRARKRIGSAHSFVILCCRCQRRARIRSGLETVCLHLAVLVKVLCIARFVVVVSEGAKLVPFFFGHRRSDALARRGTAVASHQNLGSCLSFATFGLRSSKFLISVLSGTRLPKTARLTHARMSVAPGGLPHHVSGAPRSLVVHIRHSYRFCRPLAVMGVISLIVGAAGAGLATVDALLAILCASFAVTIACAILSLTDPYVSCVGWRRRRLACMVFRACDATPSGHSLPAGLGCAYCWFAKRASAFLSAVSARRCSPFCYVRRLSCCATMVASGCGID